MDRNHFQLQKVAGIPALLTGLMLAVGCDTASSTVSVAPTDATSSIVETPAQSEIEPSPLKRIAPPNLIQLTEFKREEFDSAPSTAGPQLVLPLMPASNGSAATSVDDGEPFMVVDPPAATSAMQSSESQAVRVAPQVPGTMLPWGATTATPEMMAVAQRAEDVARRGYYLAERGGMYSARARFTESLRIIAEALDAQRNTTAHTKSLAAGLRALEEVDDFVPRGAQVESNINLPLIVDAHRTPVLKDRPLDAVTPLVAQRAYLTYAQEQLAMAGGDQAVASLALHGLAKICISPAELHGPRMQIAEAKAVVYFQAAVIIEPRNFMSANELGVLLARFGRPAEARQAFEQAVASSNAPTTWRNLAMVNERLGDTQKASICRERATAAVDQSKQTGTNNGGSQYSVRWVDAETFAQSNTMVGDVAPPPAAADAKAKTPVPATAAKPAEKSSGWKWPWQ